MWYDAAGHVECKTEATATERRRRMRAEVPLQRAHVPLCLFAKISVVSPFSHWTRGLASDMMCSSYVVSPMQPSAMDGHLVVHGVQAN